MITIILKNIFHILETRQALNLEEHWKPGNQRPCLLNSSDKNYEQHFTDLLDSYQVPLDYFNNDSQDKYYEMLDEKGIKKL